MPCPDSDRPDPYRERAGHDLTYCAVSGALDTDSPAIPPVPLADHAGALQAVNSILAALLARTRTGQGCRLDVALHESLLSWQYLTLLGQAPGGSAPGLLQGKAACYNLYRTADHRTVALAALEEKFWRRFCQAVGRPEWIPRHAEPLPQEALIDALRELFVRRPARHWQGLLEGEDCCFEILLAPEEVAAHPQLEARAMLSGMAPRHPLWIRGRAVGDGPPPREISAGETPGWQS